MLFGSSVGNAHATGRSALIDPSFLSHLQLLGFPILQAAAKYTWHTRDQCASPAGQRSSIFLICLHVVRPRQRRSAAARSASHHRTLLRSNPAHDLDHRSQVASASKAALRA